MLKRFIPAFIVTLSICSSVFAENPIPSTMLTGWNAITQTSIRNDLTLISSDKFEGRLALQAGDNLTIKWIENEFKTAGLKPAAGNSYLQPVNLIEYMPDTKHSYVILDRAGDKKSWKKPRVFTEFFKNIQLTGQVLFAGYGITAPELNYDDYQNVDAAGKIVLIFEHEPQETDKTSIFNGTGNTIYATTRIKALNAQKHGAIAVLVAPEPNRKHPSNQERRSHIGGSERRAIPLPSMVLVNDELQIPVTILSDQAAKEIAGPTLSLSQLQSTIDRDLKPQSQLIPDSSVSIQDHNLSQRTATTYNVAGILEGSDPALKQETIIISAHHDHDGKSGKQIWHGADDNASGTVGVVELARAMSVNNTAKNGLKPKRSILFVVFAGEERGLLGAFYMTKHPLRPLDTTRAMINFDMIGRNEKRSQQTDGLISIPRNTKNRLNLIGSRYSPDYNETVKGQNRFVGLDLDDRFDYEYALNIFFRSDQYPFVLQGIPAFWWFTGFHPDYHHTTDIADKINYAKMQKILRLAYLSTYEFADNINAPNFIKSPH